MRGFGEHIALYLMTGQYVHWALCTLHVVVRDGTFETDCFFFFFYKLQLWYYRTN